MPQRPRVFITGARRGIGRGIAFGFAEAGYDVVINDLVAESEAQETLAGLRERGAKAVYLQGNIADVKTLPRSPKRPSLPLAASIASSTMPAFRCASAATFLT